MKTHRWFQFDRGRYFRRHAGACGHLTTRRPGITQTRAREGTPRLDGRAEKRLAEGARTRDAPSRLTTAPAPAARTLPALGILRPGPPLSPLVGCQPCFFLKSSPSKRARLNARGPVMCSIPDPRDPTVPFTGDRTGHTRRHGCKDAAGGSGREAPEARRPTVPPRTGIMIILAALTISFTFHEIIL